MRLGYGISLQQTQKLIMTPQLRQAITVLQLGTLELYEYIQQQLLENPVLEVSPDPADPPEAGEVGLPQVDVSGRLEAEGFHGWEKGSSRDLDPNWLDYFADSSDLGYVRSDREEGFTYENFLAQAPTLHEHLLFQLHLAVYHEEERRVGEWIIGNIDDNGYLRVGIEEIAKATGASQELVSRMLSVIQTFDPAGVGARTLEECLLLQIDQAVDPLNPHAALARRIVKEHLKDLADGKLNKIACSLGVGVRDVQAASDLIRSLDPKPGRRYGTPYDVRYVIPDVVVQRIGGEYVIVVNESAIPRIAISPVYKRILSQYGNERETKKFIENKLNSAVWFLRSIEQRRLTLYRVVETIVKLQKEFFEKGIRHLKPMTLREVALIIGIHESTVSRAIANKYVQTPHGVFELRFFFSSGVRSRDGSVSAESVKKMILDLLQAEDPYNPLSDQQVVDILAAKGITISRRTVAKYRNEIGTPPSTKRRRYS